MWTFETDNGSARIQYDSLIGAFLTYYNDECLGGFLTPQLAADAVNSAHRTPKDLAKWRPHSMEEEVQLSVYRNY